MRTFHHHRPYINVTSDLLIAIILSTPPNWPKMTESIQNGVFRRNNTAPPVDNGVMSLFSLKGKTAVISGAGGGIGLAAAKAFAEAGANVAIWYNTNEEAIDKAAGIAKAFNIKCNKDEPEKEPPFLIARVQRSCLVLIMLLSRQSVSSQRYILR